MPIEINPSVEFSPHLVNRFSLCQVRYGLFPTGNQRATFSTPSQSRSESCIAINPRDPYNLIGASKKFIDPAIYLFKLGVVYTFDRGKTWKESNLPMMQGWDGMTDPTAAFDDFGNAFLVGEPLKFHPDKVGTHDDLTGLGMVVYRSKNGGVNWENPVQLTTDPQDDKQMMVCDNHPKSPYYGNVYVAWGASSPLRFARSTDHGDTWKGKGNEPPGSNLVDFTYAPEMSVSPDGTLHILWHIDGSSEIRYLRSTDGGTTFGVVKTAVTGIESLRGNLPLSSNWPHFANAKFRVITLVSDCVVSKQTLVIAWADMREGHSRIYYRRSLDNGLTWEGPSTGQPLLPQVAFGDSHCFHPQISTTQSGVIGCAFYTFHKQQEKYLIRVQLAASWDHGDTFSDFITVTNQSWDPLVNAPLAHGNSNVHFIGEYFGLDAGEEEFALLWTDTRTGVQELMSDVVHTEQIKCPQLPELVGQIFGGVSRGGDGYIFIGGVFKKIPPRSPVTKILEALMAYEAISDAPAEQFAELRLASLKATAALLQVEIDKLSTAQIKASQRKQAKKTG